eukprot:TRINITY_DN3344_c0_g1_i1.p1 TRINITY_DN3344_c0_g1~~TRINITY_DN3344_c0_g1_i1.p1  ORF type:complete len:325 (+),score=41.10 TRINITY_DN3344_c0_g1_i1:130-1104(+)
MIDEDTIPPQIGSATLPLFGFDVLVQNSQQQWRSAPKFRHGADTYVLSEPGQPYHLKVFNNSREDIAVRFEVDGTDWPVYHTIYHQNHVLIQHLVVGTIVVGDQCHEKRLGLAFGQPALEHKSMDEVDRAQASSTGIGLIRMKVYRCKVHYGVQRAHVSWGCNISEAKAPENKKFFLHPLCTQYSDLGQKSQPARLTKTEVDWSGTMDIITCHYKTKESLVLMKLMPEEKVEEDEEQPGLEPIPEPPALSLSPRPVKPEPNPASLKRSRQKSSQRGKKAKKERKGKQQPAVIVISDDEDESEEQEAGEARGDRRPVREVDLTQD